jgi:hypothetical protein
LLLFRTVEPANIAAVDCAAHLDLPDAFTRNIQLQGEIVQRQWLVDQMSRLED